MEDSFNSESVLAHSPDCCATSFCQLVISIVWIKYYSLRMLMSHNLNNRSVLRIAAEAFVHLLNDSELLALCDGSGAQSCIFCQVFQFHMLKDNAVKSDCEFLLWEIWLVEYGDFDNSLILFDRTRCL